MNRTLRLAVCSFVLFPWNLFAEEMQKAPPAPVHPYFNTPPPGSSWSVSLEYAKAEKATSTSADTSAVLATKIDSTYGANKVRKVVTAFSDGSKTEYYVLGSVMLQKYAGSDQVALLQAQPAFPGIEWIPEGGEYVGLETIDKSECYKFKIKESYLLQIPWPLDTQYYAWIDVVTKFPIQAKNNEILYQFSPITSGAGSVVLPPEYQEAANQALVQTKMSESFRRLNRR